MDAAGVLMTLGQYRESSLVQHEPLCQLRRHEQLSKPWVERLLKVQQDQLLLPTRDEVDRRGRLQRDVAQVLQSTGYRNYVKRQKLDETRVATRPHSPPRTSAR
jgi:hypothetical protein